MRSKDEVRKEVWKAMDREGVSRFPGAEGRIPNFAGAKLAAEKLAGHRLWKRARVIKANPDSPQTHARRLGARRGQDGDHGGAAPARPAPLPRARPEASSKASRCEEAATIKGALKHGRVVALDELPEIDFVLCGSVAVNLSGARVGKGGGYSDLEYGILIDAGKIDDHTTVATTVHPIQILRRAPDGDRPRPAGRPDRDPARGDRGRAPVRAAARASSGTTCSRRRSARSRSWNGWAMPERDGRTRSPLRPRRRDATAGPDYGNPDPSGCGSTGAEHLRRVELPGAEVNYVEIGGGRAELALRPRHLRLLAELAREPPPLRPQPPGRSRSTCPASAPARCPPGRSRCRPTGG